MYKSFIYITVFLGFLEIQIGFLILKICIQRKCTSNHDCLSGQDKTKGNEILFYKIMLRQVNLM